jgi:tetratricopeptide (TPR) repeat protein
MARLDRMAPAKEVAQVGAMIGREFGHRLLGAVLRMAPARLDAALGELVRAELVARRGVPPEAVYTFRHALIRDTAYNSMLKGQRAIRHGHIAAAIEQIAPDTVATQPELLAYHCQEGGQAADALRFWAAAGDLAVRRWSIREAATHYRAALALLPRLDLPAQQRDESELDLQMRYGHVLMQTEGYTSPVTVASFARARELASQLGQTDTCVIACSAFGATLWASGRFAEGLAMLDQFGPEEQASMKPMSRVFRAIVSGLIKLHLGRLEESCALMAAARRDLEDIPPEALQDVSGADPRVVARTQSVSVCVPMGLLDQADAHTLAAVKVARERGHPPTQAWAMSLERWMAFRHGDMEQSIRLSRERLALAERLGLDSQLGSGQMLLGRAMVGQGEVKEGARLLREGFARWSSDGSQTGITEFAVIAADALLEAGCIAEAESFVAAGEKALADIGEVFFAAELARLRARLSQHAGDRVAAENGMREAIAIAERQGARLFVLRAANDLARLLHSMGRAGDAQAVLRPALDGMPEGLDQPDALRAKATLKAIVGSMQSSA